MKLLFSFLIIVFFLASCQTKNKEVTKSEEVIQEFKPFLHGNWVISDYIDAIIKTKSPLKSSDKLRFISEFTIDTTKFMADSVIVGAGYGNHEGGEFVLYFHMGQNSNSLTTNIKDFNTENDKFELGYSISQKDTLLALYHYDKNKNLIETIHYLKSPKTIMNNDLDCLQYAVNKNLISGSYKMIDSVGRETKINLIEDGGITGFKDLKTYYILTDFVVAPENATDEICFEIQTKAQSCYSFKIVADTINLFQLPKNENNTISKNSPLMFKLIRQH